ncbi:putative HTH-type transcriptional regulator [Abditibacteriota bacterium]|nr:putative HTH-type transcriptional regulator [Abditibacteriota bacterium]
MGAKTKWRIELFGGLRVSTGIGWLTQFRTRRAALLLARLALEGVPLRRDTLVEWLWPDSPFEVGRNRLSVALSALRRALETPESKTKLFIGNHDLVGLNFDEVQCDVLEVASLLKHAQAERDNASRARLLRDALALWHGPLWDGDAFDWLLGETQRLNDLLCEAALALSELDAASSIEALQRAYQMEPAREDISRALMRSLVAHGKNEEAQRVWRTLEKRLRVEHNRAPSSETRALARRLLDSHEPATAPPHIERLPTNSSRFFGRQNELERLSRWLSRDSDVQLITIFGGSGHGKTRLALEAARRNSDSFDESPCFVSLVGQYDARKLLEVVGDALQTPRSASQTALERIVGSVGERRVLLLLDNFEHLASAAPDIERLLKHLPSAVCLITSRCLLALPGEHELVLTPLPVPSRINEATERAPDAQVLEEWARNPAIRLFADRARAVSPSFRLHTGNAGAVARLCRALEGVPLALELAAARSLALSPAQIEQNLGTQLDILERDAVGVDEERHRSIRAALDWSYDLLSPTARRLFRRLSVFRGSWTLDRANAICTVSPRDDKSVIVRAHEELRRHSLLEGEDEDGELRFRFLETVRLYARERATRDDKRDIQRSLETRHAHEFARFAQNAVRAGRGQKSAQWMHLLERDQLDFRAGLSWALENDGALALRFAASLWWFWFSTARFNEGRESLKRALEASEDIADSSLESEEETPEHINWRAEALSGAGFLAWRQGDMIDAIDLCSQACDLSRTVGDTRALTYSLIVLQMAALVRGDFEELEVMGDECLRYSRADGDQQAEAFALHLIGAGADMRGDAQTAWSLQEQSVALFEAVNSPEGAAWVLFNWGNAARRLGNYERAIDLCSRGRGIFQTIASREGVAYCNTYAGLTYCDAGNKEMARTLLRAGLKELFDLGALWGVVISLEGVARNLPDGTESKAIEATRLWSAAQLIRTTINAPVPPVDRVPFLEFENQLRQTLPVPSFKAAWETGRSLSLEQTVRAALEA